MARAHVHFIWYRKHTYSGSSEASTGTPLASPQKDDLFGLEGGFEVTERRRQQLLRAKYESLMSGSSQGSGPNLLPGKQSRENVSTVV